MNFFDTYSLMTLADHETIQTLARLSAQSWDAAKKFDLQRAEELGNEWRAKHEQLFQTLHERSVKRQKNTVRYNPEVDRHTLTNLTGVKEAFELSLVLRAAQREAAR